MNLQDRAKEYLEYCTYRKELDAKTVKAYRIDLKQYFSFVCCDEPEKETIERYITNLHKKYKQKTVKRKIASVKAFYSYLEEEEMLDQNPFRKIKVKFKETIVLPRIIPREEIEQLLNYMYTYLKEDVNPTGLKLLNISNLSDIKGKTLLESSFELAPALAELKQGDDVMIRTSTHTIYHCIRSAFIDQGFKHPFILIEEITQELLKVEKDSYERIIRMMSHEVNNSVGAIGSTLNVVADIFKQDENGQWEYVLPAVEASFERCRHLASFISNLAHAIRVPEPTLSAISLNEQARSVYALTDIECRQRNIRLVLTLTENDRTIEVDGVQIEQVLVNIIKNAYEAIGQNGEIRITTQTSPVSILIEDNGPGISEETQKKLFTPFFTTKSSGQGIGLMFVREVLTNHHCQFSLSSDNGWTRFTILFNTVSDRCRCN